MTEKATLPVVHGHESAMRALRDTRARGFAFVGPDAVGRRTVAHWWAALRNCAAAGSEPCGRCASCEAAAAGRHPDVLEKAPARSTRSGRATQRPTLRIDQLVPRATPNADPEPVRSWLEVRPQFRERVAILDDAHLMSEAAGNAFLKTLEEPPAWARIVLIAPSREALLPTLASRVVTMRFGAAPVASFVDLAPHPALDGGQYGRLQRAREDPELEALLRDATHAFVASLEGPLDEALAAGSAWVAAWMDHPREALPQRLLVTLRRDAPERYALALDVVDEAERALRAYVGKDVVAAALTLRLRNR